MHEHITEVDKANFVVESVLNGGWTNWAEFLRELDRIGKILGVNVEPNLAEQPLEISDALRDQDWPEMCLAAEGVDFGSKKTG